MPTACATGIRLFQFGVTLIPFYMNRKESTVELRIQSSLDYTDLIENVTNNLTSMAGCSPDHTYFIEMAVREIVTNAIQHGNRFDSAKEVQVQYRFNSEKFEVQIRDQGNGFDFSHLPDPCDPANLLKSSGRGIFLVRSFMDDFSLSRLPERGTEVRFVKKLTTSKAGPS